MMLTLRFTIGNVIRLLREQKGLDQGDLGIHAVTASKIEQGVRKNPKPETLQTIAQHLGTTVAAIYAEVERLNGAADSGDSSHSCDECSDVKPKHAAYHDLLNIILHNQRNDADFWRQGIATTLTAYAAKVMESEDEGSPNYNRMITAIKLIGKNKIK